MGWILWSAARTTLCKPDHRSQGSQLSVSTSFNSKTYSFKGKAMSPMKKKLSMRMTRRKMSKQRLVEGASSPHGRNAKGKQRGIMDFFVRMDGPIRASSGGRSQLWLENGITWWIIMLPMDFNLYQTFYVCISSALLMDWWGSYIDRNISPIFYLPPSHSIIQ